MNELKSKHTKKQKSSISSKPSLCQHVKTNGEFCAALALRGRNYCYFHLTHIGRRLRAERVHELALSHNISSELLPLGLPLLEDANSIQLALSQVVEAIMRNQIDARRAGLVLYALQTASSNLANGVNFQQREDATVAGSYDDFERDFQLGETAPELRVADDTQAAVEETVAPASASSSTARPSSAAKSAPPTRTVRAVPTQQLEVTPAVHMLNRKPPVFAYVGEATGS